MALSLDGVFLPIITPFMDGQVDLASYRAPVRWNSVAGFIPSLFREPNPAPIKYLLWKKGLISSPELRLPMTGVSTAMRQVLDGYLTEGIV